MFLKVVRWTPLCILTFTSLLVLGCSQSVVSPDGVLDAGSRPVEGAAFGGNQWIWGSYTIAISGDHAEAEFVPLRGSSLHLNVNGFVEGPPCPKCLSLGVPHAQPDGTVKLGVILRHPFPLQPEYTGFDVRGIAVFKATDYFWSNTTVNEIDSGPPYLMEDILLYFSDPVKGGAAILNPDGYTFYLNPLLIFEDRPILNYSKGKQAVGDSPDCTVNPYILFADDSPRRMFKTTDQFMRTYHIKPPEGGGPFEFGYVVSACWAKPDNMPVTDPEADFPVEANCEDPYAISVVQLQPFDYDVGNQPIFKVRVKHRVGEWPIDGTMIVPTLSTYPDYLGWVHVFKWGFKDNADDVIWIDDETTEFVMRFVQAAWDEIGDELVPGTHLGILETHACGKGIHGDGYYSQLYRPIGVHPVYVNVVID